MRSKLLVTTGVLAGVVLMVMLAASAIGRSAQDERQAFIGETVRSSRDAVDRTNVVQTVDALFTQFDAKDWAAVGELLDDRIEIDFTSVGGTRGPVTRDELVGGWRSAFATKTSLHATYNHQVRIDGDRAEVFCHGYAYNRLARDLGSDVWEVWGTYRIDLRREAGGRWRITREDFHARRTAGNEAVREATGG